jgi:hypothetical protein
MGTHREPQLRCNSDIMLPSLTLQQEHFTIIEGGHDHHARAFHGLVCDHNINLHPAILLSLHKYVFPINHQQH